MKNGLILGFFDGIHLAHQAVIESAVNYAENAILITFKDSPAKYFSNEYEYIYTRKKLLSLLKNIQIVELDFPEIAEMSAEKYLEFITNEFKPVSISTGFNHTFGFNRSGDAKLLEACRQKYGYKYFCIPPQIYQDKPISSTRIKECIREGNLDDANKMLGKPFSVEGKVIRGAQIGRKIGFPTANIIYPEHIVKLPYGVYKGGVNIFSKYHTAIINWGLKPTVNNTSEPIVEVHILDFEGDLYDQDIEVEILKKIRNEIKFNNLEELKTQIEKDIEACLKL